MQASRRTRTHLSAMLCALVWTTSGCKQDCNEGYALQPDGSCYAKVFVGQETFDTGIREDHATFYDATVQGEVRRGNVDLDDAGAVSLEVWTSRNTDLYGPDRDDHDADQEFPLDLEALRSGETVTFSEVHPGIPLRGREIFVYVRVQPAESGRARFYAAEANPYVLFQDQTSEHVEVVIDTTTETR